MGLDVTFFIKTDKGFEDIVSYRNNWEILNWFELEKLNEREPVIARLDATKFKSFSNFPEEVLNKVREMSKELWMEDSEYDLYPLSREDVENLVERAEYVIEKNHCDRNNRFSDDFCPLVRSSVEEMDEWSDEELEEYLNDVQDYIDTLKPVSQDIYVYLSY